MVDVIVDLHAVHPVSVRCVTWYGLGFVYFDAILLFDPLKSVDRLLAMVHEGCPGHGPVHLLSASAAEIGFERDPHALAWIRPGLPLLGNLAGPVQHFKAAILEAWRDKVSSNFCCRKGFRGGPLLDVHGSLQLLNSSHVREPDKALLRSVMVGSVWNWLAWVVSSCLFRIPCSCSVKV